MNAQLAYVAEGCEASTALNLLAARCLTSIQSGDRPERYGRSWRLPDAAAVKNEAALSSPLHVELNDLDHAGD
jgi:hypothetical protein